MLSTRKYYLLIAWLACASSTTLAQDVSGMMRHRNKGAVDKHQRGVTTDAVDVESGGVLRDDVAARVYDDSEVEYHKDLMRNIERKQILGYVRSAGTCCLGAGVLYLFVDFLTREECN